MMKSRILAGAAALSLLASPLFAQTPAPTAPAPARPAVPAAPAAPAPAAAKPATAPVAAPTPVGQRVNINTATAAQLDTLKGIGEARAKKIIEERAKGRFKNFDDLVKRNVLPSNVEADIKDKITF
jgi:competence protein ComEA